MVLVAISGLFAAEWTSQQPPADCADLDLVSMGLFSGVGGHTD